MHLVYLDDGGKNEVLIFGGIVVTERQFRSVESECGIAASAMFPGEAREAFRRFHASDLFNGTHDFKGIPEDVRHRTLRTLVRIPGNMGAPYFYSAVNRQELRKSPVSSASAHDMGFQMCAMAIDNAMREQAEAAKAADPTGNADRPLTLFIVEQGDDGPTKQIKNSFRRMRKQLAVPVTAWRQNPLFHSVDDLFFGDSNGSFGLQVADACNWVMWRRIADGIEDQFFTALMRGGTVRCAKPEPMWTQFRNLYLTHENP